MALLRLYSDRVKAGGRGREEKHSFPPTFLPFLTECFMNLRVTCIGIMLSQNHSGFSCCAAESKCLFLLSFTGPGSSTLSLTSQLMSIGDKT